MKTSLYAFIAGLACASIAEAHELWLEPREWQVAPGAPVEVDIKVGEDFAGPVYAYIGARSERFDVAWPGGLARVRSRDGDRPAARIAEAPAGLHVFVHQSDDTDLTYSEFAKFEKFVTHKAFPGVIEAHRTRGLPETGFVEVYSRYAKALVGVGDAEGEDRAFGLETEIVALANPYTDDLTDGMPVRVLYQGAPREGAQVEVFAKPAEGEVEVSLHTTDANGEVTLPVQPGVAYQVDAVVAREPSAEVAEANKGAVWETLWANLTFKVPEG